MKRTAAIASTAIVIAAILGTAVPASAMSPRSELAAQSSNGSAVQQPSSPAQTESADLCSPVYDIGGSIRPPVPTHMPDPMFSKEGRDAEFSGNVLVGLVVDRKGKPCNVHLLRGVGMGLDENAVIAVQHWRFKPATQNGKPVAVNLKIEVNFNYAASGQ